MISAEEIIHLTSTFLLTSSDKLAHVYNILPHQGKHLEFSDDFATGNLNRRA